MRRYKTVKLEKKHLLVNFRYAKEIATIGMASFLNQLAMLVVQIVMNNSLTYYGALSEFGEAIPLACAGIVIKVNQIFFSVVIGLSQGCQPIASFNYGAKKYARVREAYRVSVTLGVAISLVSFALFQICPRQILQLFGDNTEQYFAFGVQFFRIFLFFTWLNALQPLTANFFTSIGKPKKGIFLSLTRQLLFFLPLIVILPRIFGVVGLMYTAPIADVAAGIVAITMAAAEFRLMKRQEQELAGMA